jgi:hypothetical protein
MKKSDTVDRWGHDLYDATEQTPKSDQEFLDQYGCERSQVNRYSVLFYKFHQTQFSYFIRFTFTVQCCSRGPSQFGSSHEGIKSAYPRPVRGRGGKPPPRYSQFKRDDISALNEDMKKVYL